MESDCVSHLNGFVACRFKLVKVYRPHSRGTLKLASADVTHTPIVQYNYLSDPRDVRMCVNGVKILSAVIGSKAMANYNYRQVSISSWWQRFHDEHSHISKGSQLAIHLGRLDNRKHQHIAYL